MVKDFAKDCVKVRLETVFVAVVLLLGLGAVIGTGVLGYESAFYASIVFNVILWAVVGLITWASYVDYKRIVERNRNNAYAAINGYRDECRADAR